VDPEQRSRKEIRHDGRADEHGLNRRLTFEDTQAMNNHHQHRSHYSGYPLEDPRNRGERVSRTQNMQAQNDAHNTCTDLQAMRHQQHKRRPDFHGRDFTARHQWVETPRPRHDSIAHQNERSTNRNDGGNYAMNSDRTRVSKETKTDRRKGSHKNSKRTRKERNKRQKQQGFLPHPNVSQTTKMGHLKKGSVHQNSQIREDNWRLSNEPKWNFRPMKNEKNWPKSKNKYFAPINRDAKSQCVYGATKFPNSYHTVRPEPQHKLQHTPDLPGTISQDETPTAIRAQHEQQYQGSQTHFLVTTERHEKKMGPSKPNQRTSKSVLKSQISTKAHGAERQIRGILKNQRSQNHFLAKREAVIDVQTKFFCALRRLNTWPLEKLTFCDSDHLREIWTKQLEIARKCAYRAETIDPIYSGPMRYDTMCEIVTLETQRVTELLLDFEHFRDMIIRRNAQHPAKDEEGYCDQTILAYLKPRQADVALSRTPHWIDQAERPPLTWYGFLAFDQEPIFTNTCIANERILAPEYYE
jgi:hypothetical protein